MNKIIKVILMIIGLVAWNIICNIVISAFHAKYGTVQVDTGQLGSIYVTISQYLSYTQTITDLLAIIGIGHYISKY